MGNSGCGCGCSGGGSLVQLGSNEKPAGPAGPTPALATTLTWRDGLGGWGVRWGIGRMRYLVAPGLYRVGAPDKQSAVLVTANYKLTVDAVRRELTGLNVWLLVLDTKGVNVWCAAGKGTFGTAELIRRIATVRLAEVVDHRNLVVPQLGATGVAAHEVKRASGFLVHYGPVLARDIPAYLAAGLHATPPMRRVTFGWRERIVLVPMEVSEALKPALLILGALALLEVLHHRTVSWHVLASLAPFLAALLAGSVLVPLLLPWLPTRAFAVKGAITGALCVAAVLAGLPSGGAVEATGAALLGIAMTSYLAMMFTGATTFTNLAGARLEVRRALPPIVVSAALGALLRVAAVFV
jgi:hypothetical protein